jgi:hypothetical protein
MSEVPEYAAEDFWEYCKTMQEQRRTSFILYDSVEAYIEAWVLDDGTAFRDCAGDFRIFVSAVCHIFASWHDLRAECKNEADWSRPIPWQVSRALKGDKRAGTEIFNPLYFEYHRPCP